MTKKTTIIRRFNVYETIAAITVINMHPFFRLIDSGELDMVMAIMSIVLSIFFILIWYRTVSLYACNDQLLLNQGIFDKGHRFSIDSIQEIYVDAVNHKPYKLKINTNLNHTQSINLKEPREKVLFALHQIFQTKMVFHKSLNSRWN